MRVKADCDALPSRLKHMSTISNFNMEYWRYVWKLTRPNKSFPVPKDAIHCMLHIFLPCWLFHCVLQFVCNLLAFTNLTAWVVLVGGTSVFCLRTANIVHLLRYKRPAEVLPATNVMPCHGIFTSEAWLPSRGPDNFDSHFLTPSSWHNWC